MGPVTFPGIIDSLKPIRDYVADAGRAAGLDRRALYNLCLAVDEIATNIVVHGYEEAGRSGPLRISTELTDEALSVILEDEGISYDSLRHVTPSQADLSKPLELRKVGGLGIYLARRSVDRLECHRLGEVNRTIFIVSRSSSREPIPEGGPNAGPNQT